MTCTPSLLPAGRNPRYSLQQGETGFSLPSPVPLTLGAPYYHFLSFPFLLFLCPVFALANNLSWLRWQQLLSFYRFGLLGGGTPGCIPNPGQVLLPPILTALPLKTMFVWQGQLLCSSIGCPHIHTQASGHSKGSVSNGCVGEDRERQCSRLENQQPTT